MPTVRAASVVAALAAVILASCETTSIAEPDLHAAMDDSICDQPTETPDPDCGDGPEDPPPDPGDGTPTPLGTLGDDNLYEAPGDPFPTQPGVFLGSNVNPAACFIGFWGAPTSVDHDADAFSDTCEFAIARAFAPYLQFANDEQCGAGAPYWAAKGFQSDRGAVVSVAYMPAFFWDCGAEGLLQHWGDSEFIRVSVAWHPGSQHWEFTEMFISAHCTLNASGVCSGTNNRSEYVPWSSTSFPVKSRAFPMVWLSSGKHSNYRRECENFPQDGVTILDDCDSNPAWRRRFPVLTERNVGSPHRSLVTSTLEPGCVQQRASARTECFYAKQKPFNGWHPSADPNEGVTSYWSMLFSDRHFETLSPGARPDYLGHISGPGQITSAGSHTWTASAPSNVTVVWEKSSSGTNWQAVGESRTYSRDVDQDDPHFYLRLTLYYQGILVRVSSNLKVFVDIEEPPEPGECEEDVDWCETMTMQQRAGEIRPPAIP